nr:MARVEL domain-containing protein 3-like isoform X2 [Paramormyrops kingsleyae]
MRARKEKTKTERDHMSQTRSQRGHRDGNNEPRVGKTQRDQRNGMSSSSGNRSSSRPSYPRSSVRHSHQEQPQRSKWTYICSRRGIVLMCTVLTNILVLICVVAAMMVMSGMSAMGGLAAGSFSINTAYTPFEGTELQQVRDLDMKYNQMRSPGVYGGVAFSLTLGVLSLLFVVSGNRPAHLLPRKLLLGKFVFQVVGAVAYVVAVGLYLHFVIQVNATDVCTMRERLYARQGYTWMNCNVGGGDASVALFGLITAGLYAAGAVLTGITIRHVRNYLSHMDDRGRYSQEETSHQQEAPLRSDTTFV